MQINRNQKVLAGELKPGDRFYKFGDKNKKVWEVDSIGVVIVIIVDPAIDSKYRDQHNEKIQRNRAVVFLRSKTENF